jgi:leucyl-tRNA synthetase
MKPWNPQGIEGVHRFLRSLWREVIGPDGAINAKMVDGPETNSDTDRLLHQTIEKVTADIVGMRYNTAISQMMILRNQVQKAETVSRETIRSFVLLLQPFAPHIASELWERLGEQTPIHSTPWPKADPAKLITDTVKLMIQVNGKLRGEALVAPDASQESVVALANADEKDATHLTGKTIRKVIYVPGRILNFVVG